MNFIQKTIIKWLDLDTWIFETWLRRYREDLYELDNFKTKLEHGESVEIDCDRFPGGAFGICKHGRLYSKNIDQ